MKKLIIFSGTTEGRELSEKLAAAQIPHIVSVATSYGELVMEKHPLVEIHNGRMTETEMLTFLREHEIEIVADATHPYAVVVTASIRSCVELLKKERRISYLRLERQIEDETAYRVFSSHESCKAALEHTPGNILLTTGSKELASYCRPEELRKRLFVRVLPGMESLAACRKLGLLPKQILALQGPFLTEMNLAILKQYDISCMVSKLGGINGGFPEKKEACRRAGIPLFVILKEPDDMQEDCYDFTGMCRAIGRMTGVEILCREDARLCITLAGIGMGNTGSMTNDTASALREAHLLIGAERVIQPYTARLEKKAAYMPEETVEWLVAKSRQYAACGPLRAVILFSGDSGFYSGCQKMRQALQQAIEQKRIRAVIKTYPGISSVQAMAAACGAAWQNAGIYSIHGRTGHEGWERELLGKIRQHEQLFLLVSGVKDVRAIGTLLAGREEEYRIYTGYQLSCPQEEVRCLTPVQCSSLEKEGLYTLMICHRLKEQRKAITPGIGDGQFIRGSVPMTKEEIRKISICKLQLKENAVLYDIGSGTGTIAVEAARLHPAMTVYAIEQKQEAVALEEQNREKFQAVNMKIIEGRAPEILVGLESPTHAFIGGSGGNLTAILKHLYRKNPQMRVVINAVSLETLGELNMIEQYFPLKHFELIQVQISRYRQMGDYHLPKAENPVMICSFTFRKDREEDE